LKDQTKGEWLSYVSAALCSTIVKLFSPIFSLFLPAQLKAHKHRLFSADLIRTPGLLLVVVMKSAQSFMEPHGQRTSVLNDVHI
jgi:hypothetical protein